MIDMATILLSVQRALLGEVSPRLRGASANFSGQSIRIDLYFDGEIAPDDEESVSDVEGEIAADLPPDTVLRVKASRIDVPRELPAAMSWAYRRRE
jgi:hypothetical protein